MNSLTKTNFTGSTRHKVFSSASGGERTKQRSILTDSVDLSKHATDTEHQIPESWKFDSEPFLGAPNGRSEWKLSQESPTEHRAPENGDSVFLSSGFSPANEVCAETSKPSLSGMLFAFDQNSQREVFDFADRNGLSYVSPEVNAYREGQKEKKGPFSRAALYLIEEYPDSVKTQPEAVALLHQWNQDYPASEAEMNRHDEIALVSGRTNSYIRS